jgi:hypothetical protein
MARTYREIAIEEAMSHVIDWWARSAQAQSPSRQSGMRRFPACDCGIRRFSFAALRSIRHRSAEARRGLRPVPGRSTLRARPMLPCRRSRALRSVQRARLRLGEAGPSTPASLSPCALHQDPTRPRRCGRPPIRRANTINDLFRLERRCGTLEAIGKCKVAFSLPGCRIVVSLRSSSWLR